MIFIWDARNMDRISVYRTLYSHSGPIYDLQYIPNTSSIGLQNTDVFDLADEANLKELESHQ